MSEARIDNNAGIHNAAFQQRLAASISYDKVLQSPEYLGYNADRSDGRAISEAENRAMNGDIVKYNGSYYTDVNP